MKNMKRFAALGLSIMMMASMSTGVFAAGTVVQQRADGDTVPTEGTSNVDVDGWITPESIIDTNGSEVAPSYTGTEKPLDPDSSTTDWGDDSTKDSSQLIVTAPAKLSFLVAGKGADANIQLTTTGGKTVTGTIENQSCYITADKDVVPKKVSIKASQSAKSDGKAEFQLVKESESFPSSASGVKGVYLHLGTNKINPVAGDYTKNSLSSVEFAGMTNAELGTLPAGTRAQTQNKAWAVNPSKTEIYFADKNGTATGVETQFASSVKETDQLESNYQLNMVYTYLK